MRLLIILPRNIQDEWSFKNILSDEVDTVQYYYIAVYVFYVINIASFQLVFVFIMKFTVKFDLKCIFGYLIFQIFLGGMPPDSPTLDPSLEVARMLCQEIAQLEEFEIVLQWQDYKPLQSMCDSTRILSCGFTITPSSSSQA